MSKFQDKFSDGLLENCRQKFTKEVENIIKKSELENQIASKFMTFYDSANNPLKIRSYASTASKSAFALKPKNSDQSVKATKADVQQNIDFVDSEISISQVVPIKNGGIVVQCHESESLKFKQLANSKLFAKYEVKQLSMLHPRVKIVGLSEKLDGNVILRYLKYQNKSVFSDDSKILETAGQASGLRLTSMYTPVVADVRENMELECSFDMGKEDLYSVKWYKDDHEFFRYKPRPDPHTMSFPVAGVYVVSQESNCIKDHCTVKLHNLSRHHTTGAYRCEISSEAPAFRLASETHSVTVAALPRADPKIDGLKTFYTEGDTIITKCISDVSDPPAILSWFVNGQPAPIQYIGEATVSDLDSLGLAFSSLTLYLPVDKKLSHGDIELLCQATIPGLPLPPRNATARLPLRNDMQVINNQKLHWFGTHSGGSSINIHFIWGLQLLLIPVIQRSI